MGNNTARSFNIAVGAKGFEVFHKLMQKEVVLQDLDFLFFEDGKISQSEFSTLKKMIDSDDPESIELAKEIIKTFHR